MARTIATGSAANGIRSISHRDPLPLVMSEPGCLYRYRMIHATESAGRAWHIAYTSPNIAGIQAQFPSVSGQYPAGGAILGDHSYSHDEGWISINHQHGTCARCRDRREPGNAPLAEVSRRLLLASISREARKRAAGLAWE